ncbi:iron-containing alcohol dehydrogenase family protein [Haloplasma contractile]|uniref:Glycerol dehydrogenase protein n=1 Tax=Haloplasma contractile SSD-17B TaxID=1033810 RepID=U2FGK3_9MOLU|nr:iron-containing alcohol dehydrogenase family protein [Haloplasma contractile]ERJ11995.1 glycerol dehydrogenase protein [Haloplasma contractile SSD-17B]
MSTSSHLISIPTILEVGNDCLQSIGKIVRNKKFKNVVVFFSDGIFDIVGETVLNSLEYANINILYRHVLSNIQIEPIVSHAFSIPNDTEVIIGIGGGRAIDASKYMAFLRKIPFISIPTSTSNDGFSSSSSSLIVNETRTTVHAKMPYGIIIDTSVIKGAPLKFMFSGIGDLISNIPAITDWLYEERQGITTVNDFAAMIASKSVNSLLSTEFSTLKDDLFLQELVNSLTLNGIAMEIAGTSAPCSGSEHLISHALDQYIHLNELHGIQVGIASYIMSHIQGQHEPIERHKEIKQLLLTIGFFDYVKTLNIKKDAFKEAIKYAPTIKPERNTYIHDKNYRNQAIEFILTDQLLAEVLV